MKKMNLLVMSLVSAAALSFTSCSDSEDLAGNNQNKVDKFYMTLTVQTPTSNGTRTAQKNPHDASKEESYVTSGTFYLVDANGKIAKSINIDEKAWADAKIPQQGTDGKTTLQIPVEDVTADLKTDVDTMSYAMGMSQTQGLKEFMVERMGVDTAYMDDFIKGLNDGANAGDDKKKAAYYAGIQIGQQISNQMVKGINHEVFGEDSTKSISLKNFMAGFITGTTGKKGLMTVEQAAQIAQAKMMAIKAKNMEKEYGPNKVAGEKFLAANKKKPGVVTLPSGVQYKVIKEGNGPMPKDTSMVKVNYEGKTIDGKVFDSSFKRGQAVDLRANQVIKGWTEALVHMPAGSVWEVYIPQQLAYGEREQGQIKPFSVLIFKIELISVGGK